MGKEILCPRFTKSYLRDYKFSGLVHECDMNLPERIKKLLNYAQHINPILNQALINWYESDGSIGRHSDNKSQLRENSDVFSFSFGPSERFFILEPKKTNEKTFHIKIRHNTLIVMGGQCQSSHKHSVPKVKNCDKMSERRLNVTFRCFK